MPSPSLPSGRADLVAGEGSTAAPAERGAAAEATGWRVPASPFETASDDPGILGRDRRFAYGPSAQNLGVWGEIVRLGPAHETCQPARLLREAYRRIVAANRAALDAAGFPEAPSPPSPEYWDAFRRVSEWDGAPLDAWKMWTLLRTLGYSEACCASVDHVLGIEGPFWAAVSAGETFELLEALL